ncbi:MAG: 4Fe-4S binding protein [Actinomycetota bacterium]|nr:4Fe-4S binding protein [Actinomycetota bacterium]
MALSVQEEATRIADPVPVAVHLRPPVRKGVTERFSSSDVQPSLEVTRFPLVARLIRNRKFQFFLILPNQIVFWAVVLLGFVGTADPGLNFGTAITWYVWFCLVFVMMVVVGRAWCVMCPFGGFAEWIQRRTFWKRTQKSLGLGRKFPARLARYGFLIPVVSFLILTWLEEFFNIAGPGNPIATSFMVIGIVASALVFFMVFERRTFCRYICPLSTLIGSVGSMGSVAGFRTKDREVCLSCTTKDCMRGSADGYGCPWYTWPGSADSNLYCGLCSECYKSCPEGNVGLFLQKPLTSVVAPRRRRIDVAWGIALLFGLVLYQQFNATNVFAAIDNWLNTELHFPQYPNPVDYLGFIIVGAALVSGVAWLVSKAFANRSLRFDQPGNFIEKKSQFRTYFMPIAYGLIPIVGADYFARQLPKFLKYSPRVVPAVMHIFGFASAKSSLFHLSIMTNGWIVFTQVAVIVVGTLASAWSMWRITRRELVSVSRGHIGIYMSTLAIVLASGVATAVLYVIMHAAN